MLNMNKMHEQRLLWFSAGFALATVLSIGVTIGVNPNPMRFIPVSVAFGLLCVGTGVVFTELVALRRQEKMGWEVLDQWKEMKAKLQEEKESVEAHEEALEAQGLVLDEKIKEAEEMKAKWQKE